MKILIAVKKHKKPLYELLGKFNPSLATHQQMEPRFLRYVMEFALEDQRGRGKDGKEEEETGGAPVLIDPDARDVSLIHADNLVLVETLIYIAYKARDAEVERWHTSWRRNNFQQPASVMSGGLGLHSDIGASHPFDAGRGFLEDRWYAVTK